MPSIQGDQQPEPERQQDSENRLPSYPRRVFSRHARSFPPSQYNCSPPPLPQLVMLEIGSHLGFMEIPVEGIPLGTRKKEELGTSLDALDLNLEG